MDGGADFSGIVVANEMPGLTVVLRKVGTEVRISRFGAQGYTVSTSIRSRIVEDPSIQAIWLTFLSLAGLTRFITKNQGGHAFDRQGIS